jgi:hypothetical protein
MWGEARESMAKILFTGTSRRAVQNWLPALDVLRTRGHDVCSLLFPHHPDPDSAALAELNFACVGTLPIIEHLSRLDQNLSIELASRAAHVVRAERPDVLLLTTCHAGPETLLMELLAPDAERPVILGCQHGFVQLWHVYWGNPCFDYLFVFGDLFFDLAPEHLRARLVAAACRSSMRSVPRRRPGISFRTGDRSCSLRKRTAPLASPKRFFG